MRWNRNISVGSGGIFIGGDCNGDEDGRMSVSTFSNSQVQIGNKTYTGKSVVVKGNTVYVDGKKVDDKDIESEKEINITINGDVNKIDGTCDSVTVNGNVKNIDVTGNINIDGNVDGDVDTTGNLKVSGDIKGDIDITGNITRF